MSVVGFKNCKEIEGLLFNNIESFNNSFGNDDFIDKEELINTIVNNEPEDINDSPDNSPSKRLKRLIRNYNKIVHGTILASEIGLSRLKNRSPRFNEWITKLENI